MPLKLGKNSGGVLNVTSADGTGSTNLVLPESGTVVTTTDVAVVQNQVDTHVSVPTAYHIYNGGVSIDNTVITNGFSTTLYTGNGTSQTVTTNVDMSTQWGNDASEKFGGLVWLKGRSGDTSNYFTDTVRGVTKNIASDHTGAESTNATGLTAFSSTGFSLGALAGMNTNTATYASWNFQTTHRRTGVTSHGKAYTEHYNPYTGFGIISLTGSGLAGHELQLGINADASIFIVKKTSNTSSWYTYVKGVGRAALNVTNAFVTTIVDDGWFASSNKLISRNGDTEINGLNEQYIIYYWANSYYDADNTLIGNYEVGVYQGTGASGNKVTTRGKPAWGMIKRLDAGGGWWITDNKRANDGHILGANLSSAEITATDYLDYNADGFTLRVSAPDFNASSGQYLYMVVYDNDSGSGKSKYPKATDTTNLSINALVPYANGIDGNGSKVSISYKNETISGLTLTQGKNYIYSKNDGTYGSKAYQPQYGSLRDRSVAGENPDYFDLAKQKWFSTSGGSELVTNGTFDTNTTGWTADSSNILSVSNGTMLVNRNNSTANGAKQTISTIIGKQYKIRFKVSSFANSGTSIVYIGNTSNGSEISSYSNTSTGSFEYSFIAQSTNTYLHFGVTTSTTGIVGYDDISVFEVTPTIGTEITPRTYLDCIVYADHNGQPTYVEELPKTTYFDEIKANDYKGKNACTAWVSFDGTTTPPTIRDSYNVASVVRTGTGLYDIYFKTPMDNVNYSTVGNTIYTLSTGASVAVVSPHLQETSKVSINTKWADYSGGANINLAYNSIQILGGKL